MASTQLIIKGAFYFNGSEILQAHYTGEFFMVDCTEFKRKKDIKKEYDKSFYSEILKQEPVIYEDKKYYRCEFGPHNPEDFILLSDLSELEHNEDSFNF